MSFSGAQLAGPVFPAHSFWGRVTMPKLTKTQWFINGLDVMPKLTPPQWTIVGLTTLVAFMMVVLTTAPR
jgi:hypothetical protein